LFGENFFNTVPVTYTPVERVPVPADYVLGPGDELYIRIWGAVDADLRMTVDRNGQISVPRVGTFGVAGLRAADVEGHLRSQIGRVFKGFSLNVTLGQLRSIQIFVVGQAQRPGTYTVGSLSTLINAVFASGGPGPNGSLRRVQLKRGSSVVTEFDLYDFIVHGDKSRDARLLPGDVIVYATAGPRVAVLGAVDTPAVFELKPGGSPLAEVLALAGGQRAHSNPNRMQLERIEAANPKAPRRVVSLQGGAERSTLLRDGDIITVFPVEPQFANAVTLRGNVADALRYPHTPGMRISQLIPERDALITKDYYTRKNKLVQFLDPKKVALSESEQSVRNLVDEPNWEYATIERLDSDKITTTLLPFNLARAILDRDPAHDLVLQPGDVVTIFGSKDIRGPQARGSRLVRVEGEVERPGVYQLQAGETLRGLLQRAGGHTKQAYLFGLEFSRVSTRQRQRQALDEALKRLEAGLAAAGARQAANLSGTDTATAARLQAAEEEARRAQLNRLRSIQPNGRIALELEPAAGKLEDLPDVPLEDGDAVFLPTRPGFIYAVGAVANENAILWRADRTVRQYLASAGVNPEADVNNIFVVRADGSVVHSRDSAGFWGSNRFNDLQLAPGDTLVVPDLANRETPWSAFVRGAKDWTQILSNFGLAAAAIKTLR
jgi:protein involved in polysaccharide export with SLBB domain